MTRVTTLMAAGRMTTRPGSLYLPLPPIKGADVLRIQEMSGMTRHHFADFIGVSPETLRLWMNEKSAVPGPALIVLHAISQGLLGASVSKTAPAYTATPKRRRRTVTRLASRDSSAG